MCVTAASQPQDGRSTESLGFTELQREAVRTETVTTEIAASEPEEYVYNGSFNSCTERQRDYGDMR